MEDLIADTRLHIIELQSSIKVLKQAVSNEFEEINREDIHNHLQILMWELDKIVNQFNKISNKYTSS